MDNEINDVTISARYYTRWYMVFYAGDLQPATGSVRRTGSGRTAPRYRANRMNRPFHIDAWVLLPDHLHCIWTLPEEDADYPTCWNLIKRRTSEALKATYHDAGSMTASKTSRRELTFWQRRYWEHRIRDEHDFERHADYIHFNPVKHGYVQTPQEWEHSSIHRYQRDGIYPPGWGCDGRILFEEGFGGE